MLSNLFIELFFYIIVFIIIWIFLLFCPKYKANLIYIGRNFITIYRNFFHWTISKIIIASYSRILWILINVPLLIIISIILYSISSSIDMNWINTFFIEQKIDSWLITFFLSKPYIFMLIILLLAFMLYLFIFAMFYWELLMQNLFKNYINWEKIWFFKNKFLDLKTLQKYFWILFYSFLYTILPLILCCFYIIFILILWYWSPFIKDMLVSQNIYFAIINMGVLIFFWLLLIHLTIRLSMSNFCLLYTDNIEKKSYKYIKESFVLTKWKIFKIISFAIPFIILGLSLDTIFEFIFTNYIKIDFIQYLFNYLFFVWIIQMFSVSVYQILIKERDININKEIKELL